MREAAGRGAAAHDLHAEALGIEAAGEGGYARELTEEERAAQQQALTDAIKKFDVVITTALVPGRPAPKLVTAEAVEVNAVENAWLQATGLLNVTASGGSFYGSGTVLAVGGQIATNVVLASATATIWWDKSMASAL